MSSRITGPIMILIRVSMIRTSSMRKLDSSNRVLCKETQRPSCLKASQSKK